MPTPDRIYGGQELIDYIRNNTEMTVKKKAAMRTRKDGAKVVWSTRQELQRAAKEMSKRAGNDIYGWSTLAEIAGSAAIKKTLKDGNFDKPGGDARYSPSTFSPSETVKLLAHNNNAPAETVSYNQRVIDSMIPTWVSKAMRAELKQLTPARLAKGLKLPSDVKIKFE